MPILLTSWISGLTLTVCPGHGFSPACLIVVRSALTILEKADQTNLGQLCNLTLRFLQLCLSVKCEVDGLRYDIPFPVLRSKPNGDWWCHGWNLMRGGRDRSCFLCCITSKSHCSGMPCCAGLVASKGRDAWLDDLSTTLCTSKYFLLTSWNEVVDIKPQHNLWIHGKWW